MLFLSKKNTIIFYYMVSKQGIEFVLEKANFLGIFEITGRAVGVFFVLNTNFEGT